MKLLVTFGMILSLAVSAGVQSVRASEKDEAAAKKHEIVSGDTLWSLSGKYYGDPFKWNRIYNANMDKISDPDRIYPAEEIYIPDLTETVKYAALPPSEDAQAPAEMVYAAAAGKVSSPAEGRVNPSDSDPADLSMEMPADQKEWSAGSITIVPKNWKADGVIISRINDATEEKNDSLTTPGDRVRIKVKKPASFRSGDMITAYMKGAVSYDAKTKKKLGVELQKTGVLEVLSVNKNIVKARILRANTSVDSGQVVKR